MKNIGILIFDISKSRGTERAVINLANMLSDSKKYNVFIISFFSNINQQPYYPLNTDIKILHLNLLKKNLFYRVFNFWKLLKKIRLICKQNYIEIMIGSAHALNILISYMPKQIKKIGCEHINYYACPIYSRIIRKIKYKKLNYIVVLSEKDKKNYYSFKQKVKVIPNSLPFKTEKLAPLKNKRILAVGALSEEKGLDSLIDMCICFKKQIPDWHIDIFGEGNQKKILQERINKNLVSDYIYLRGTTENIRDEYLNSSIYVLTSKMEAFPMVLLEAQSCGLPIVSFNCDYGPALIVDDGKNGFIVPVGDLEKFEEKVIQLAKDIELRLRFGHNGYESSKKYNSNNIFHEWDKLLTE